VMPLRRLLSELEGGGVGEDRSLLIVDAHIGEAVLGGDAAAKGKVPGAAHNGSRLERCCGNADTDEAEGAVECAIGIGESLREAECELVLATVTIPALNAADQVSGVVEELGFAEEVVKGVEDTECEGLLDYGGGTANGAVFTGAAQPCEVLHHDLHVEVQLLGFLGE